VVADGPACAPVYSNIMPARSTLVTFICSESILIAIPMVNFEALVTANVVLEELLLTIPVFIAPLRCSGVLKPLKI